MMACAVPPTPSVAELGEGMSALTRQILTSPLPSSPTASTTFLTAVAARMVPALRVALLGVSVASAIETPWLRAPEELNQMPRVGVSVKAASLLRVAV